MFTAGCGATVRGAMGGTATATHTRAGLLRVRAGGR